MPQRLEDWSDGELAMNDELMSLKKSDTWKLMKLPFMRKYLHEKWVHHVKHEANDGKQYKIKPSVKGFEQYEGVDYIEIFTYATKLTMIRLMMCIVVVWDLHLE